MKIIAFGHRKNVGKDTAANYLQRQLKELYPYKLIKKTGFAVKVKDIALQLFEWAGLKACIYYDKHIEEREIILPLIGKTPRELWIGVGNGVRAATGYDGVWLDYVFNHYEADVMIISDLRFSAEADGILRRGGLLYKIVCPWTPVVMDGADELLESYNKWTGVIENNEKGNLQHLYNQIDKIINEHF